MANLVFPFQSASAALERLISSTSPSWINALLCMFATAHTPMDGDTAATYLAIEASFTGYARQVLTTWSSILEDGSLRAYSSPATSTFHNSTGSGQLVYGAFVLDSAATTLLGVGVFDGSPITMPPATNLLVDLTLTEVGEFGV